LTCNILACSDHVVLLVESNFWNHGGNNFKRLNFRKGDYDAFKIYMACNWEEKFLDCCDDVDKMWNVFKQRLINGVETYVPLVKVFNDGNTGKLSSPLGEEIRKEIRLKSKLWKSYIRTKDHNTFLKYKRQRNKTRYLIRQDEQQKQSEIALDSKRNPKRFWNFVNSKTKTKERIGDLKIQQDNSIFVAHMDVQKVEVLCDFFSSVFVHESDDVFDPLPTRWKTSDRELLSVDETEVIDRIKNLNINNKGPGLIHSRILYELRNEIRYPLMTIFNCSLATKTFFANSMEDC